MGATSLPSSPSAVNLAVPSWELSVYGMSGWEHCRPCCSARACGAGGSAWTCAAGAPAQAHTRVRVRGQGGGVRTCRRFGRHVHVCAGGASVRGKATHQADARAHAGVQTRMCRRAHVHTHKNTRLHARTHSCAHTHPARPPAPQRPWPQRQQGPDLLPLQAALP